MTQDVDVVFYAVDEDGRRVNVVFEDRGVVGEERRAEIAVFEPWFPVFGAVDDVDQHFG